MPGETIQKMCDYTKTAKNLTFLTDDISSYCRNIHVVTAHTDTKPSGAMLLGSAGFAFIDDLLKSQSIDTLNKSEIDSFLSDLMKQTAGIEIVNVSVPYEPSEAFMCKLYDFLKSLGWEAFIIKSTFAPEIKVGIQLSYKGKFYDFSLDKFLDKPIWSFLKSL